MVHFEFSRSNQLIYHYLDDNKRSMYVLKSYVIDLIFMMFNYLYTFEYVILLFSLSYGFVNVIVWTCVACFEVKIDDRVSFVHKLKILFLF